MKQLRPLVPLFVAAALVFPVLATAQTFELVSPPNAWYSTPVGIRNGKIYGSYSDLTDGKIRAFTYSKTEGYVIFEVPGADGCCGTLAQGIDDTGRVAGSFRKTPQKFLSYVRQANGQLRIFDANPRNSAVTAVTGMNGLGFVTGDYRLADDSFYWPHGYVRSPVGVIFHIDVPGTAMTYPSDINDSGVVTGWYAQTVDSPARGFLRYPPVFYVTFDPPAGCQAGENYYQRINNLGDVVGTCLHDIFFESGYVRWRTGVIERIDFPGAIATQPAGIAEDGTIAGTYYTAGDVGHGFVRSPSGVYTSFDVPGADAATTRVDRIDAQGNITGHYFSGDFLNRTYIRYRE